MNALGDYPCIHCNFLNVILEMIVILTLIVLKRYCNEKRSLQLQKFRPPKIIWP
jgi:hypothetical protein